MTNETSRTSLPEAPAVGAEAPLDVSSGAARPAGEAVPASARDERPVRLLVLGTGNMARLQSKGFSAIPGVTLAASVDVSEARRAAFNGENGIRHGFASIEEALAWGEFDAVTNITPDAVHYVTTLPFLRARKHVLCEKPLATNYAHAAEMAQVASMMGVVNMVNLTYRNVAALNEAARLVAEGAIGEVRHFEASYLQSWLTQPAWGEWSTSDTWLWRLSKGHGSMGVLGDVGVHIIDYASHIAGSPPSQVSCRLATFDKAPGNRLGEYLLDANDSAVMHVKLANGAVGVIHATRYASGHLNDLTLRLFGTRGGLEVRGSNAYSQLRGSLGNDMLTGTWQDMEAPPVPTNYQRFIAAIRAGTPVLPDFARGAMLQRVIDLAVLSDQEHSVDKAI